MQNGSRSWQVCASGVLAPNGRHINATDGSDHDYLMLAYRRNGGQLWSDRYDGSGPDSPGSIAISPDGTVVVVTGEERDVYWFAGTIAYATR